MNRIQAPIEELRRSRRSYVPAVLVVAVGVGALVAVLALPAIERVVWPDSKLESER
jgi:hypothetical protein